MKMLRKFDIIKHVNFKDVAIQIISADVIEVPRQGLHVKGMWINQGYVETYSIPKMVDVILPLKDLKNWEYCVNIDADCIRYTEWRPLMEEENETNEL